LRLRDLERALAAIPPHPKPRVELEQYATPATLAAPLLFEAYTRGDVEGRRVVDLGCGTGVFALGAALLGAAYVTGVDADAASLDVARAQAARLGVDVEWVASDVAEWQGAADTVLMNPPFGAQSRGADRPFLDRAFATAPVVYTIHHAPSREFVERYAAERGYVATDRWRLVFPLRHQYAHQEKAVKEVETVAFRLARSA
jgi:putative methylase